MDYKYEEIIRKYFGLNQANHHLMNYGSDLTGLLHSASIIWDVDKMHRNYCKLKNEVEESIRLLESAPWYSQAVKNEVKERLVNVIQDINSNNSN